MRNDAPFLSWKKTRRAATLLGIDESGLRNICTKNDFLIAEVKISRVEPIMRASASGKSSTTVGYYVYVDIPPPSLAPDTALLVFPHPNLVGATPLLLDRDEAGQPIRFLVPLLIPDDSSHLSGLTVGAPGARIFLLG